MEDETIKREYQWEDTGLELPMLYITATFSFEESGRHPLDDQMEYESRLSEVELKFEDADGADDESPNFAKMYLKKQTGVFDFKYVTVLSVIMSWINEEWENR